MIYLEYIWGEHGRTRNDLMIQFKTVAKSDGSYSSCARLLATASVRWLPWYADMLCARVVFSAMMLIYLIWCVHVSLCRQWCHFSHAVFLHVCLPICCACPHIFLWARRSAVESSVVRSALAPAPPCPPATGSQSVTIVLRKRLVDC